MANTKSAIKRIRSTERKRKINIVHRSRARTYIKRARELIVAGKFDEAEVMVLEAGAALDKAAQKGIIHKNNAARRKSRLVRQLNKAKQQAAAEKLSQPVTITNSIGIKLALIPAGECLMGSSGSPEELAEAFPGTELESFRAEFPQHKVRITKAFYLGSLPSPSHIVSASLPSRPSRTPW